MKQTQGARSPRTGSRTRWWRNRLLVTLAIVGMVAGLSVAAPSHDAAWAKDYPSWADVLAARNNLAAKQVEIDRIQRILKELETQVAETQAVAEIKGAEFQRARDAFDDQNEKALEYQKQADEAQEKADTTMKRVGQMAARLARTGGGDLTATLLFSGDNASNLLSQLGMASKVSEQSKGLYDKAIQEQNTAQSLTDQANVARDALAELKAIAEKAQQEAQAAADAATSAFAEQQANNAILQAQLATLQSDRIHTEGEYIKGVQEQWGGNGAVEISSSGWARPASGRVSDGFGPRVPPTEGVSSVHRGLDIGAGCNSPIFAAHTGRVSYAGWMGTYGNFIIVEHEDGISTAYAHIVTGGIMVSYGQTVGVGQQIARVGSTGASTGCHLHFEVRIGGNAIDPQPFMRDRGINIS